MIRGNSIFKQLFLSLLLSGCSYVSTSQLTRQSDLIPPVQLSVSGLTLLEGSTTQLTFTLPYAVAQEVSFQYSTFPGTAAEGTGFTPVSGRAVIAPGATQAQILLTASDNSDSCELAKNFFVDLSEIKGAGISSSRLTITVEDDEAPTISLSSSPDVEGQPVVVTATLSHSCVSNDVTFQWQGVAGGTATVVSDFPFLAPQTATVPAGQTTVSFSLPTIDDVLYESDETARVQLTNAQRARLVPGTDFIDALITENDSAPTLVVGLGSVIEGTGSGTTMGSVPVTVVGLSAATITADCSASDNEATLADSDFNPVCGGLVIPPFGTSGSVAVSVHRDNKHELNELVSVTLSGGDNYTVAGSTLTGTLRIDNDDPIPTLVVSPASVTEGNAGAATVSVTVTLSNPTYQTVLLGYGFTDGTARSSDGDYSTTGSTLSILPGNLTGTFLATANGDTKDEYDEYFNANISGGANYTVAGSTTSARVTILDDDAPPTISITDSTEAEGTGAGSTLSTFYVNLSAISGKDISVNYATQDGQSTNPATSADGDFVSTSSQLTIPAGDNAGTITISVIRDDRDEEDESYLLNLSGGENYTVAGSDLQATAAILNDDIGPTIQVGDLSIQEGTGGVRTALVPVTLSRASGKVITVLYSTADQTATVADADYTAVSNQTLTFNPGVTSVNASVLIGTDSRDENDETLNVLLSGGANYLVAGSDLSGALTILDDDSAPTISITDVSATEGSSVVFTVSLNIASGKTVTANYSLSAGTASIPGDLANATGTVSFAPGVVSQTVSIPTVDDAVYCESSESFSVNLAGGSNYTAVGSDLVGVGTILENDLPVLDVSGSASVEEGQSASMTASISPLCSQNVSFRWHAISGSAESGTDFSFATSGTGTIAAGDSSTTFSVPTIDDSSPETTEFFTVAVIPTSMAKIQNGTNLSAVELTDNELTSGIAKIRVSDGGFACGLSKAGVVKCWGADVHGGANRGDGPGEMGLSLAAISLGTGRVAQDIAVGTSHACALLDTSEVKCWGLNSAGQLGTGDTTDYGASPAELGDNPAWLPVDFGPSFTPILISAGGHHTCAVSSDYQLKCWGEGADGKLGRGSIDDFGGNSAEMGVFWDPVDLADRSVMRVSASRNNTCLLLSDLTVSCLGRGVEGQLGNGSVAESLGDLPAEVGTGLYTISLGASLFPIDVTAGLSSSCALFSTGSMKCWGDGSEGVLGNSQASMLGDQANEMGDFLPVVSVGSGLSVRGFTEGSTRSRCVMLSNQTVKCFGRALGGALGNAGEIASFNRGHSAATSGDNLAVISLDPTLKAISLSAGSQTLGDNHCVLFEDGRAKCWGYNSSGQLGLGDMSNRGDGAGEMGSSLPYLDLGF